MWDYLKTTKKPILLYGMGNGADKIIKELESRNIIISGVFANDNFVRGQIFHNFKVITYDEAKLTFKDFIVLLCFGSHDKNVIDRIKYISKEQELFAPDVPVYGQGLFDKNYVNSNLDKISFIKNHLADEQSIKVFENVISYKLTGKLEYLFSCQTDENENWDLLSLNNTESYLDLGAYNGDTISLFLSKVDSYNTIIALEPERHNFNKLQKNTADLKDITLLNQAISDVPKISNFVQGVGRGSSLGNGKEIEVNSIDNIVKETGISFIKFDVEGQELNAIKGGSKTIKEFAPKMLISAYHRVEDLFDIPINVLKINPKYRVFLRHACCVPGWEINYYFI